MCKFKINVFLDQSQVNPEKIEANVGDKVEFVCKSTKTLWFHGENSIPISKNEKLIFESVVVSDQGYYKCQGHYDNGDTFISKVYLIVCK